MCAALALGALLVRRVVAGAITGACALYLGWPILAVTLPARPEPPAVVRERVTVATANVLFTNTEYGAFEDWLAASAPDVLAVQEITREWRARLSELAAFYPHRLVWPDSEREAAPLGFGIGLYSRLPITRSAVHALADGALPLLEIEVPTAGGPLRIFTMHPPAPQDQGLWAIKDAFLERVPGGLPRAPNVVLLADLNTSGGSPRFADLLAATGLADSRRGFGWLPSWRTDVLVHGLWVDLDHVLVGSGVTVLARGVRTIPGSDHRAATATLALRP